VVKSNTNTKPSNLGMTNQLKIYLLTLLSFFVGTSQFIIAGVLDKIADSLNIINC
jgi:predicted MFS family arabinose efflux permease